MTISYSHPNGVQLHEAERPLLSTPQDGLVAVDDGLVAMWHSAAERSFDDLAVPPPPHPDLDGIVPEALACLAEAGLLARNPPTGRPEPAPRAIDGRHTASAVIIVSVPGELTWLEPCVRALMAQHHTLECILVVDNDVGINMRQWLAERSLLARVHSISPRTNFASALNIGFQAAPASEYFLFMNADMKLHRASVGNLIARAQETENCAAVAPKLLFWRAPAFLNGIGNRVPGWGFGTDNGVGQLDLGQLDVWTEVPSGCLGALLVAREALLDVGPFDARYPLYYEDTDWSFRARLQGYRVAAAPDAEALHAFGGSWDAGGPTALSPIKLGHALVGQQRFAAKIGSPGRSAVLLMHALKQSGLNVAGAIRSRDLAIVGVYAKTAARVAISVPSLALARWRVQSRRAVPDRELFAHSDDLTPSMTWRNLPELTCMSIRDYYAPLMRAGKTRAMAELP